MATTTNGSVLTKLFVQQGQDPNSLQRMGVSDPNFVRQLVQILKSQQQQIAALQAKVGSS